jgi:transporter family-2 protein
VLGGALTAAQSRVNGELAARLHDGFGAAVISFGSGLVVIVAATLAVPAARRAAAGTAAALRTGTLRPWECLGGTLGAYLVATQGLTVAALGVALFTVSLVAGQAGSGLAVDRWGLGPGGPSPVTVPRLVGAALAVLGVAVAGAGHLSGPGVLALAVLPLLAGAGVSVQQALNGRVRQVSGHALAATLVNFVVGTAALVVAFAVDVAVRGWPDGRLPTQPVWYLGGLMGVAFISVAAAAVRHTGVLLLGLAMVTGQLVGAVALDVFAPTRAGGVATGVLAGTGLALAGVLVAAAATRRPAVGRAAPPGRRTAGRAGRR